MQNLKKQFHTSHLQEEELAQAEEIKITAQNINEFQEILDPIIEEEKKLALLERQEQQILQESFITMEKENFRMLPYSENIINIPYTYFAPFDEKKILDTLLEVFTLIKCPPDSQHRLIKIHIKGKTKIQKKVKTLSHIFDIIMKHHALKKDFDTYNELQREYQNVKENLEQKITIEKSIIKYYKSKLQYFFFKRNTWFQALTFIISSLFLALGIWDYIRSSISIISISFIFSISWVWSVRSLLRTFKHNSALYSFYKKQHSQRKKLFTEVLDKIHKNDTFITKEEKEFEKNIKKISQKTEHLFELEKESISTNLLEYFQLQQEIQSE